MTTLNDARELNMTTDHELLSGIVNVKPVIVSDAPDAHQVWLDIGCQHFTVGEYQETKDEAEFIARQLRIALGNIQPIVIKEMVNRFLGWKLPEDFAPDHGIRFVRNEFHDKHGMPTGTNLLHAGQAKSMFQHCVAWQAALSGQAGESSPAPSVSDAKDYIETDKPEAVVHVDSQGVRFGAFCWISHERITGRDADALNSGKGGLAAVQYMKWLNKYLNNDKALAQQGEQG